MPLYVVVHVADARQLTRNLCGWIGVWMSLYVAVRVCQSISTQITIIVRFAGPVLHNCPSQKGRTNPYAQRMHHFPGTMCTPVDCRSSIALNTHRCSRCIICWNVWLFVTENPSISNGTLVSSSLQPHTSLTQDSKSATGTQDSPHSKCGGLAPFGSAYMFVVGTTKCCIQLAC